MAISYKPVNEDKAKDSAGSKPKLKRQLTPTVSVGLVEKSGNVARRIERVASNFEVEGSSPSVPARSFINTTNHGLKVKMPDSVHIFLPGETIEFLPKELGEDGADRELARRARRAEMKSKASMDWAKRKKGR